MTVTDAVALSEPEVTVIVAVPSAAEVTAPLEDTVATAALDELHDTATPPIVAPFWSLTVADNRCVAPKDEKLKEVADSVIDVATGVGGLVGVVSPSPHARSKSTAESLMKRMGLICGDTRDSHQSLPLSPSP